MSPPPSQRVALVTGGAVRVGAALSLGLAEAGYDVVVAYHASEAEAERLASAVRALGREALTVRGDLAEADACAKLVRAAREAWGRLDLVVNSASMFVSRPLEQVDAAGWDRVMAVNVRAPHLIVREAADLLRASNGAVVNIVDLSALEPWPSYADHSVSKAALLHLTRVQARALAPAVRVNAVAPGDVLKPVDWPDERWDRMASAAPLGRPGSPQDVVEAVLYLARAEFVTGQVLAVDGGRALRATAASPEF